jgi:hypothetical protein
VSSWDIAQAIGQIENVYRTLRVDGGPVRLTELATALEFVPRHHFAPAVAELAGRPGVRLEALPDEVVTPWDTWDAVQVDGVFRHTIELPIDSTPD